MSEHKKKFQDNMTDRTDKSHKADTSGKSDQPAQPENDLALQKKCDEYLEGWQRAKADYQNLKKEVAKEREQFARFARINWLMQILPIYNNLQKSFEHLPETLKADQWVQGIQHIKDQFSALLKELKVEKIKTKNASFNAAHHDAVAKESAESMKAGDIIREVEPGYMLDNDVLVAAKVIVAE